MSFSEGQRVRISSQAEYFAGHSGVVEHYEPTYDRYVVAIEDVGLGFGYHESDLEAVAESVPMDDRRARIVVITPDSFYETVSYKPYSVTMEDGYLQVMTYTRNGFATRSKLFAPGTWLTVETILEDE